MRLQAGFAGAQGPEIFSIQKQNDSAVIAQHFAALVSAGLVRMQAGILVDPDLGKTPDIPTLVDKALCRAGDLAGRGITEQDRARLRAITRYDDDSLKIGDVIIGQNVPVRRYRPVRVFKAASSEIWAEALQAVLAQPAGARYTADRAGASETLSL